MKNPLFDRAMLLKLCALCALVGTVAAVLPIPRFEAEVKGIGFESPLQKGAAVKFSVAENAL